MEKVPVTITARGELSLYEQDIVLRYLGRQGLSTEVQIDNEQAERVSLGYTTQAEIEKLSFVSGIGRKIFLTRTLNSIRRIAANDGTVALCDQPGSADGDRAELFNYDDENVRAKNIPINLDTLAMMFRGNYFGGIPYFSEKSRELIGEIVRFAEVSDEIANI